MVFTPRHSETTTTTVPLWRRLFTLALIMALVVGLVAYLGLTNSVATKGYAIKELEKTLSEAKVLSQRLEAEAASLQSLNSLSETTLPEGFVAVVRVEYLSATPLAGVAVK